jgi:hypothetical protein
LVVIGAHSQNATNEEIKSVARSRGVNFTVTEGTSVQGGNDSKGIPHVIVFDHTGKCAYRGPPSGAETHIRQALAKAVASRVEGKPTKSVNSLLESLKKGQPPAAILQKAVSLSKGSDKESAEQAKQLVAGMTEPADRLISEIEKMRSSDPVDTYLRANRFSTDLKGTPAGTKAAEITAELKKDKTVVQEVKARPALDNVRHIDEGLQEKLGKDDPKGKEFHKAEAGPLKQLQTAVKNMKKSWPDAPSTKEAVEIAEKYGLAVK